MKQQTLKTQVKINGVAPHYGTESSVTIHPAPVDTGYVFLLNGKQIPVSTGSITNSNGVHTTSIAINGLRVESVEHLLSALYGLRVDNAFIELRGDEVPAIDGCANDFVKPILSAGVSLQEKDIEPLIIKNKFRVFSWRYFWSWATFYPTNNKCLEVKASIKFPNPIGKQTFEFDGSVNSYVKDLAWARTFIRSSVSKKHRTGKTTWEGARQQIPILPKDPKDSPILCFDNGKWIVEPKVFDEPVKHKIADFLGDFSLVGRRVWGRVELHWPGHIFNCFVAKEVNSKYNDKQ